MCSQEIWLSAVWTIGDICGEENSLEVSGILCFGGLHATHIKFLTPVLCAVFDSMDNSMEMEGDCTPVAMSPLKRISVSKAVIKAELRAALQQLSSHGLMHGAKWAAEQVLCESV